MARFRYSLQQVLELKNGMKKQISAEVAGLERQEAEIQNRIQALHREWEQERKALTEEAKQMVAAEFQLRTAYIENLNRKMEAERRELLEVSRRLAEKRKKLLQYAREQKILEKLRERKLAEFRKAERIREQKQLDELANVRFHGERQTTTDPESGETD